MLITQEEETRRTLVTWLKLVLDETGWSQTKLAAVAGVDQSTINRFLSDEERAGGMRASTIAKIVAASGIAPPAGLGALARGFGEPEVSLFRGEPGRVLSQDQSVWTVRGNKYAVAGFLDGDRFLLDMAEPPQPGDYVLANIDRVAGDGADTVLRINQPPFLLNPAPGHSGASEYVDNIRVRIMGVIIERWRRWR